MPCVHSQSFHPLVSITRPSGRVRRNSPVVSVMFTRLLMRSLIDLWISEASRPASVAGMSNAIAHGVMDEKISSISRTKCKESQPQRNCNNLIHRFVIAIPPSNCFGCISYFFRVGSGRGQLTRNHVGVFVSRVLCRTASFPSGPY